MKLYKEFPPSRDRSKYDMILGRGVEREVGEFLYGLVRLLKPAFCLETGTFVGDSAAHISRALRDNQSGRLHTCDIDVSDEAVHRLRNLPCSIHSMRGEDLIRMFPKFDFVHIDSGDPDTRASELFLLGNHNVNPGGIVCWHDAGDPLHAKMYEHFSSFVDWPHFLFPSVVGFAVFVRPE